MLPLSPALFLAAANALVAGQPDESPYSDATDIVSLFHSTVGEHRMTATFVGHVGYWAHHEPEGASVWPLPINGDCDDLALFADRRGVLNSRTPETGSIHLKWSPEKRCFERAAIILSVIGFAPSPETPWGYDCLVVTGGASLHVATPRTMTSPARYTTTVHWARQGVERCCSHNGDRFISWVDLDRRDPSVLSFPPRLSALPPRFADARRKVNG